MDLIDLTLRYAADPAAEPQLLAAIQEHIAALRASAGQGDGQQVEQAELAVRKDPAAAFQLEASGEAILIASGHAWRAGRFETPSIGSLRQRGKAKARGGKARLFVLDGASPVTDIGGLQATAGPGMLFQAASQLNCLESPGPYVTPVTSYFRDPTQGPRASISAFPATLLRHYRAPGPDKDPFVQQSDGRQINLLEDVFPPTVARVRNGYLMAGDVRDPTALVAALEERFDLIRIGLHDGAQVVLGYAWEGGVEDSANRIIGQVFTSTLAAGMYGPVIEGACRQLLRAAYLGTLLGGVVLDRPRVVLTLIGGGVFGNPIALIWQAICWALAEAEPFLAGDMDVVVNGYNLGSQLRRANMDQELILKEVRSRGGAMIHFGSFDPPLIQR